MSKNKRTITTIVAMTLLGILIVLFYFYLSHKTDSLEDDAVDNLSEVEKLMNKDLELYYPETPREVTKLYASMTKALYNDIKDDEVEALAIKIRKLYDKTLLEANPEKAYLNNLYTEIAAWKKKDRRITNYLLVNEELEEEKTIDGVKFATTYVSFSIQEGVKVSETWWILLCQDENENWKIYQTKIVPKTEN